MSTEPATYDSDLYTWSLEQPSYCAKGSLIKQIESRLEENLDLKDKLLDIVQTAYGYALHLATMIESLKMSENGVNDNATEYSHP